MTPLLLPLRETILLRQRLPRVIDLRKEFLIHCGNQTVHDLRVASRRLRELLDYLQPLLPDREYNRLRSLGREITKALGKLRETEVNLNLLLNLEKENVIEPIAVEILIHNQRKQLQKLQKRALKTLSSKKFNQFEKFLGSLKGSRSLAARHSDILEKRKEDFLSFSWSDPLTDERLHDLRIRTKKFRYAFEIYDRLHQRNLGRITSAIRRLQEVLGTVHDYYVLEQLVEKQLKKHQKFQLKIIPTVLEQLLSVVRSRKEKLFPGVQPLYNKVVQKWNEGMKQTRTIS